MCFISFKPLYSSFSSQVGSYPKNCVSQSHKNLLFSLRKNWEKVKEDLKQAKAAQQKAKEERMDATNRFSQCDKELAEIKASEKKLSIELKKAKLNLVQTQKTLKTVSGLCTEQVDS